MYQLQKRKKIVSSKRFVLILILWFVVGAFPAYAQKNTLDYFVSNALSNSPLLKDLSNQANSNTIDSLLIRAANKIQIAGSSNNYYAPLINHWGFDEVITNKANVTAIVGVNKTWVSQKNLASQFETIRLATEGIRNSKKLSEQDISRTITAQYITAFGGREQVEFENEIYQLLAKEDTILKQMTMANVYTQTDYLTFLTTLQQQKLVLNQSKIQYRTDYLTLLFLCGLRDTSSVSLAEPDISVHQNVSSDRSIFFQQFAIDSMNHINARELIKFNYRPKLNVFAEGGYNSSLALTPYKNFGTNFGLSLIVPIYDGKQRRMKNEKIDIAERTRKDYERFFSNQYSQQIEQLSEQLKSTESLLSEIDTQIKYSESLINAHFKLLPAGQVRVVDLIMAINNYINAKNLLTQNKVNRWQIINQINYWNR